MILEALADANLFAPFFRPQESWGAWRAFLAAVYGLPMDPDTVTLYQRHTGRTAPPSAPSREAWVIVGRRGGKSRIAALLTVYAAAFRRYTLAPGERGVAMVIAADRRQARVVFRYVTALFDTVPMLGRLIADRTAEALHLTNGISIEVHTASFRSVRGYTIVAAVLDEVAYWPTDDSANPDTEIVAALKPGMASASDALLVGISSPYARRGELWRAYAQHFGKDGDPVLVWQADTRSMNPSVDATIIAAAYEADEPRAAAEYGAQFRRDVETFLDAELLAACVEPGVTERPAVEGVGYHAAVDLSGGGADASTLALAHVEPRESGAPLIVLDCCRGWRTPNVESVVAEMAAHLAHYRVAAVVADRYAAQWPVAAFARHGIALRHATRNRSEAYLELHPLVATGRAALLDHATLLRELRQLERRAGRLGKDSVDHPPRLHDDFANSTALAMVEVDKSATEPAADWRHVFSSMPKHLRRRSALGTFLNEP